MSKQCVLIARAEINGAVQEPGYVFTLEDGKKGPHKTVGFGPLGGDVPLYEDAPVAPVPQAEPEPVNYSIPDPEAT